MYLTMLSEIHSSVHLSIHLSMYLFTHSELPDLNNVIREVQRANSHSNIEISQHRITKSESPLTSHF